MQTASGCSVRRAAFGFGCWGFVVLSLGSVGSYGEPMNGGISNSYSNPYCGVNCIYGAALFFNRRVEYTDLLKEKYLSDFSGSTVLDLVEAASDLGIQTKVLGDVDFDELYRLSELAILHVRSTPEAESFDHFVLAVRGGEKKIRLIDPPRGAREVDSDAMKKIWGGTAVFVMGNKRAALHARELQQYMGCILILIGGGLSAYRVRIIYNRSRQVCTVVD